MSGPVTQMRALDLVPLGERLRYLRLFRCIASVVVLASWPVLSEYRHVDFAVLAMATGAYLGLAFASEAVWRLRRRRGRHIQTIMLFLDGLYLAWVCYSMGGVGSPLKTLVVVHLIVVALLASFRTGMKLALWHSLLAYVTFYALEAGLLEPLGSGGKPEFGDAEFRLLLVWIGLFWLVAITTATCAAINERELRRQRYDLDALAKLAYRLEEETEPGTVASALLDAAVSAFDFERAAVVGCADDAASVLAARGVQARDMGMVPVGGAVAAALRERRTQLVHSSTAKGDAWLSDLIPDPGHLIVAPMHSEGSPVGLLIAEHAIKHGSRIERQVLSMVERMCSQAALSLDNAWLLVALERAAATDPLTGLGNRGSFEDVLARELARARRTDEPLGLIMLDVDHFKALNDSYGHQAGDAVLEHLGALLHEQVRAVDFPARYGGEEFAVVLPDADSEGAAQVAERIRKAIMAMDVDVPVTASMGVASFPETATDGESLVRAADAALYASKSEGRNRTRSASAAAAAAGADDSAPSERVQPAQDPLLRDALTGLTTRQGLIDHVTLSLARARRQPLRVALLMLDVDGMKRVNGALGHAAGDRLLVSIARRLDHVIRAQDVVARMGGDEFGVLCEVSDEEHALAIARRIGEVVAADNTIDGTTTRVTSSIGIALASDTCGAHELLSDADGAMYRAKELGGARTEVFDPALRTRMQERIALESDLRDALAGGELRVAYQPVVALADARVIGFEALLRWKRPGHGEVPPSEFIPVAEQTGLIVEIGRYVLAQACRDHARWRAQRPDVDLTMSVNLSTRQLADAGLVADVGDVLAETGIDPASLVLEITETSLMADPDASHARLDALRRVGIRIALDDFGTGYSSLGYLHRLPLDIVKVDRSFVSGVAERPEDRAIIAAVKGMTDTLGQTLVAEGVETDEQIQALRALGCEIGQGFAFSPAVSADAITRLLHAGAMAARSQSRVHDLR